MTSASDRDLTRFFDSYYRLRPVNATFTGVHDHDHRLPDWSPESLERAGDEMRRLRETLQGGGDESAEALHDVACRDRALARSFLDIQLAEGASGHFVSRNPSLALGEVAFGLVSLMTRPFAAASQRATAAIARLQDTPRFLSGAQASLTGPIPAPWRDRAVREIDGLEILLDDGLTRWIDVDAIDAGIGNRLVEAARRARAALAALKSWLQAEAPLASDTEPCGCGAELFDLLLARGHWTTRSRGELLREARAALDDEIAELQARAQPLGGWSAVQERLSSNHPDVRSYLATYQQTWDACRAAAEAHDLVTWPDYPIRYVPIPEQTRGAAPFLYYLFYRSPAPFDRLPLHDYVVTPIEPSMPQDEQRRRLRAANLGVIKLNHVVHHGAIGHHVQNYSAYHGPSAIGRVAAVDCASRIGMFLGGTMAEGWACYATELMEHVGFLTPDEAVSEQHTRVRLLARAVADVTLHEGTASLHDVVALYRDRVGMPETAARAEAVKNSMFPGAAIMYWLGTDTLRQMRRRRQTRDGARFSLRRFHDEVLSYGSIPVPLVAELMR